jgi:thiamine-phosphate pyrophosphorylase
MTIDHYEIRDRLMGARLYVVSSDAEPSRQAEVLCAAIEGGADVVQLRHKTAGKGPLLEAARRVADFARSRDVPLIVNDHVDLAIAAGADGVHLGQDDLPIRAVRRLWREGAIGRSTHSAQQALHAEAEGADYLGVGPVFATPTKPGRAAVGVELLTEVRGLLSVPWFAIGGIDASNIAEVMDAGAERVAVVRAVADDPDPLAAAARLRAALAVTVAR